MQGAYGKIPVKDGWIACPRCKRNRRLHKIEPDTTARNLPVFCRDCKTEFLIDVEKGECFERRGR